MRVMAAGLILCTAWYFTILAGFFTLYCPAMYLMFFNHKLYRRTVDLLFTLWELYPVALFQWCFNTKLHHFGDYVNPNENTIIILNHRTRIDWNYVWIALYHSTQNPQDKKQCECRNASLSEINDKDLQLFGFGGKSKIKLVLKDEIKNIPGMGWIMQLNYFLYVKRDWREDQINLNQFVDYYTRLNYNCRLVLFPEGTDLSEDNKRKSDRFANSNNLEQYTYVLHPRTTGWAALCMRMRGGLASVYDVTVAYDRPAQTEADLLRGRLPKHVYFHIKRYPIEELPTEVNALKNWLTDRWRNKEASLNKFYKDGTFINSSTNQSPLERAPRSLSVAIIGLIFWTLIDLIFIYGMVNSVLVQFWVIYHSLAFIFITWYFGGFHNVQNILLEKEYK